MFLNYLKENAMICDFQLIYDTDSKLHFDFYTHGLKKEIEMLVIKPDISIPCYGMVKVTKKDYVKIFKNINSICSNHMLLMEKIENMKSSVFKLIYANLLLEESIASGKNLFKNLECSFAAVTDVMAYRMLADKACETYSECIDVKSLSKLGVPSYLLLLQDNKEKISNDKDIDIFVKEYGYLSSFYIAKTIYEDKDFLSSFNNGVGGINLMRIPYNDSNCKNIEEKIIYGLAWYSELRHIYQLRTLRNFRWYMEEKGLNNYTTGAKELFGL